MVSLQHAAEFRRCLVQLDVQGIRRLWAHVAGHLAQPLSDDAALHTMHVARTKSETMPVAFKEYSQDWLDEREQARVVSAVGVAVRAPAHRRNQAEDLRGAMSGAVMTAYKAGVDLDTEASEVRRRMDAAWLKHCTRLERMAA